MPGNSRPMLPDSGKCWVGGSPHRQGPSKSGPRERIQGPSAVVSDLAKVAAPTHQTS